MQVMIVGDAEEVTEAEARQKCLVVVSIRIDDSKVGMHNFE